MNKPKLTKRNQIQHSMIKLLSEEHQNAHQNDQLPTKDKHIQVPTDKSTKEELQTNLDAHVCTCLDALKLHFKLLHRFNIISRCKFDLAIQVLL